MAGTAGVDRVIGALDRVVRAPFTRPTLHGLLFCLAGLGIGIATLFTLPLGLTTLVAWLTGSMDGPGPSRPAVAGAIAATELAGIVALVVLAPRIGRAAGAAVRGLARRLLGEDVGPVAPVRRVRGPFGFLVAGLRDRPGWRAALYLLVRLPVAVFDGYAVVCWAGGLVNLAYPLWWPLFRNHPAQVHLAPVPVLTPLGTFRVATFAGTFAAFCAGAAMLLVAPWLIRAVNAVDRALIRALLGPGRLARRVHDLEQTRARAVDDAAARLRRVERDLHDGAQARLAALAMSLGRAQERLGTGAEPGGPDAADLARARELVDGAHRSAKEALVELRDLARGIHPPVLDNGLADALASLVAGSALPVRLHTDVPVRPTPAIEAIAYFCAAELLANAVKHSRANAVAIEVVGRDGALRLSVTDDGIGGADPGRGSGLSGLADRVRTVDGRLDIASAPGGPTRATVELPLRA